MKRSILFIFILHLHLLFSCSGDDNVIDIPTTDDKIITDDSTAVFKNDYVDGEYTQPLYLYFELYDKISGLGWHSIISLDNRIGYSGTADHLLPSIYDPSYEWKKRYADIQKINDTISTNCKYYLVSNFTFSVITEHKVHHLYNIKQNDVWRIWRGHEVPYIYNDKQRNGIVLDEEVELEDIMPTETANPTTNPAKSK